MQPAETSAAKQELTMANQSKIDVCIIGGGVTGLSTAWLLKQAGIKVSVLEKREEAGGVIRTRFSDGYLFDQGPNSTLASTRKLADFINETGLAEEQEFANEAAANRYIVRDAKPCAAPMSPPAFLASKLLSFRGKMRLLGDYFVPPKRDKEEESLADFVRRRIGKEALDYMINPFVAGVYAGDPEQLSVKHAFKRVWALEKMYGGLIKGAIAKQKERKKSGEVDRTKAGLFSFLNGMQTLTNRLAELLDEALQTGVQVQSVSKVENGFAIHCADGENIEARQVIFATPAYVTAKLIEDMHEKASAVLNSIPYAQVAVIYQGYKKENIEHALDGFGMLIPECEKRQILGSIWSSSLFPQRAPEGIAAFTSFIGGMRQPELLAKDDESLQKIVTGELQALLGVQSQPVFAKIKRWEKAIPQYMLGHGIKLAVLENAESELPGLHIYGNFRGGISVGDCIEQAYKITDKVKLMDGFLKNKKENLSPA